MLSSVCEMIVDAAGNDLDNPQRMDEVVEIQRYYLLIKTTTRILFVKSNTSSAS